MIESMPAILFGQLSRRTFLERASRAVAVTSMGVAMKVICSAAGADSVRLALLSDLHIAANPNDANRGFLPTQNLIAVLPQVIASQPDGAIINGDLARMSGELADYEAVCSLLLQQAPQIPIYLGLGNHDDRANFSMVFNKPAGARQAVPDKHVLVLEWPLMRIILLDSLLYPTKTAGLLGKPQRQWLGQYLEISDARPTVIFVHHTLGDGDGDLLDVDRLFEIIRPHRKVKAIFYGHSHEYSMGRHQGVHLINLPAVGYNFTDKEPVGWIEAQFTPQGADLKLHAIAGNRAQNGSRALISWDI